MGDFLRSEDLGSYLRDMERRVLALETSRRPSQTFVDVIPVDPVGTFDTTYVTLFRIRLDVVTAPVLEVQIAAYTDGGSQGVWQLKLGANVSDEVPFAGATSSQSATLTFGEGTVGGGPFVVDVQAKRTTGAAGVYLFYPSMAMLDFGIVTSD